MRVSIFGSGYVGLVTGACLADAGNHVLAVDIDEARVAALTDAKEWRAAQKKPTNVNDAYHQSFSRLDRIAIWTTDRVGTMGFFIIIAVWTVTWLAWNTLAPAGLRFDPAPAFVLWLFVSNLIQIHLMPLIMVGQNLQGRHSELRAEADF